MLKKRNLKNKHARLIKNWSETPQCEGHFIMERKIIETRQKTLELFYLFQNVNFIKI